MKERKKDGSILSSQNRTVETTFNVTAKMHKCLTSPIMEAYNNEFFLNNTIKKIAEFFDCFQDFVHILSKAAIINQLLLLKRIWGCSKISLQAE